MTEAIKSLILDLVPSDGSALGSQSLLAAIQSQAPEVSEADYKAARDRLIAEGLLGKRRGRGESVYRTDSVLPTGDDEDPPEGENDPDGAAEEFALAAGYTPANGAARRRVKAGVVHRRAAEPTQVLSYRFPNRRANNPEVGMVHPENDPDQSKTTWAYDPHIDPALQFDVGRSRIEALIDNALASGDTDRMRDALSELKRLQEPYLAWAGKAERTSFAVDAVSLHVHERIDPATILANVRKRLSPVGGLAEWPQQAELFAPPFESLPLRQALDFCRHEKNWSNRLISGDSLLVMNSLLQKESMAGRVQMIYIDPPYGIKYGSNFQPFTNKNDVKDGADADLTQEPEMIKAFRDILELGIHSYLAYLRDRLLLSKDLLSVSGSIFVQISEENLHLVRNLMQEIFEEDNFVSVVTIVKTSAQEADMLPNVCDFLVLFCKDKSNIKYNKLCLEKEDGDAGV